MKRVVIIIILISIKISFTDWIEKPSWWWDPEEEQWVSQYQQPNARARFYIKDEASDTSPGTINALDSLYLAQWISWWIEGTKAFWRIRRPYTFCGKGPIICFKSNADVEMAFEGFENLIKEGDTIKKYFYFTDTTVWQPHRNWQWIPAPNLNNITFRFRFPGEAVSRKIWEKVEVKEDDKAGEYVDPEGAKIIFRAVGMKEWIEPEVYYKNKITIADIEE